jgi:hypothetical protein
MTVRMERTIFFNSEECSVYRRASSSITFEFYRLQYSTHTTYNQNGNQSAAQCSIVLVLYFMDNMQNARVTSMVFQRHYAVIRYLETRAVHPSSITLSNKATIHCPFKV